jgi:hypothetical protein
MKYLKRFNEEFDWNKLNPFSKKDSKQDPKQEKFPDDELANEIYLKIKNKKEFQPGYQGSTGIDVSHVGNNDLYHYDVDGDRMHIYYNSISIGKNELECSKEILKKMYLLFSDTVKNKSQAEKNDLKNKYSMDRKKEEEKKLVPAKVVEFFKECESDLEFKKKIDEIETHITRFKNKNASAQLKGAMIRKFNLFSNKAEEDENYNKMDYQQKGIFIDTIKKVIMDELKIEDLKK